MKCVLCSIYLSNPTTPQPPLSTSLKGVATAEGFSSFLILAFPHCLVMATPTFSLPPILIHFVPSLHWWPFNFTHIYYFNKLIRIFSHIIVVMFSVYQTLLIQPFHNLFILVWLHPCQSSHTHSYCSPRPILTPHIFLLHSSYPLHVFLTVVLHSMSMFLMHMSD